MFRFLYGNFHNVFQNALIDDTAQLKRQTKPPRATPDAYSVQLPCFAPIQTRRFGIRIAVMVLHYTPFTHQSPVPEVKNLY